MSTLLFATADVAHHSLSLVADSITNPTAVAPPGLSEKVTTIFAWVKWGALAAIFITFVAGTGLVAVGKMSSNYGAGNIGSKALIGALVGAVMYAVGYALITTLAG
ncbi:MAG: hypothetical protein WCP28_22320 [Actinomycetes bacterium]